MSSRVFFLGGCVADGGAGRCARWVKESVDGSGPLPPAAPSGEGQLIACPPLIPHETRKSPLSMLESFGSRAGQVREPGKHCPAEQKAFPPQSASMPQSRG